MTGQRVIGIDPGPTTGIVVLGGPDPLAIQSNAAAAPVVLAGLLSLDTSPVLVQIEAFVVGRTSMRAGHHGVLTRELIEQLRHVWETHDSGPAGRLGGRWLQRSAGNVKPWATELRLASAGLLEPTKGMPHARDAARHALFAAVRDGGHPDPLSKRRTP